ncbi:MAG: C-terminal binding protein [Zestosphaera sp.]
MTPSDRKKIIITEPLPHVNQQIEILSKYGEVVVLNSINEDVIKEAAKDADVIVIVYAKITDKIIENAAKLKGIVRCGIGVDNINLEAATKRGIVVANVPDYAITTVADHAFALILSLVRKVMKWDLYVREGRYVGRWTSPPQELIGTDMDGKTLGLVGFGKIGREVARRAKGFNMKVLVFDPYISKELAEQMGVELVDLDTLLRNSDIVSLHAPLTKETYHIINEDRLKLMRKNAYIVNTSRGPLIDEKALYKALKEGWIAGAALDVFEVEPLPPDNPLLKLDNVILTPHIAWFTEEALQRLEYTAVEEAIRILKGELPKNLVNKDVLKVLELRKAGT